MAPELESMRPGGGVPTCAQENRLARARPAAASVPLAFRVAGQGAQRLRQAPPGRRGGDVTARPRRTLRAPPRTAAATTGVPAAMASSTVSPKPSCQRRVDEGSGLGVELSQPLGDGSCSRPNPRTPGSGPGERRRRRARARAVGPRVAAVAAVGVQQRAEILARFVVANVEKMLRPGARAGRQRLSRAVGGDHDPLRRQPPQRAQTSRGRGLG